MKMNKPLTVLIAFFLGIISAASLCVVFLLSPKCNAGENATTQTEPAPVIAETVQTEPAPEEIAQDIQTVPVELPAPALVEQTPEPAPEQTSEPLYPPCPSMSELKERREHGGVRTRTVEGITLQLPKDSELLDEPFRAVVDNGKSYGSIYVMPKPKSGNGDLGRLDIGTEVWIIAQTRYYYFFMADNGVMGWNAPSYFSVG